MDSSRKELDKLRADIIRDVKKDFTTYKSEIIEDLEQNILARYLPDSLLIERGLKKDVQVSETAKMLNDGQEFDKILARGASLGEKKGELKARAGDETPSSGMPALTLQTQW